MKTKLSLKTKTIISAAAIALTSGAVVGSMFIYANNSSEVKGRNSGLTKSQLSNDYSKIYNDKRELNPVISIVDPLKKNKVADFDYDTNTFWFVENSSKKYSFQDFFSEYHKRYNESFVLEVKYGSFSFFDEYVLAVQPRQFIDFTKWFFENVSWGPDLVTLESFRIVPGVEQNGNSITLGSHSTLHKEVSEIKFFPDAFFGSLPIYSSGAGQSNATDALTYSFFRTEEQKPAVDALLSSIPLSSALKNSIGEGSNDAFLSIINPSKFDKLEFSAIVHRDVASSLKEYGRGTLLFKRGITEAEFNQKLKDYNIKADSNISYSKLENVVVSKVVSGYNNGNEALDLTLQTEKTTKDNQKEEVLFRMTSGEISEKWRLSYEFLKDIVDSQLVHFLDFYDIKSYENKNIFVYKDNTQTRYFSSKIEAINEVDELKKYNELSQDKKDQLVQYKVEKLSVENKKLIANLVSVADANKKETIEFELKKTENELKENFNEFKTALGYKGGINPIAISFGPEDINLKDENNKPLTGLAARRYQVYVEAYDGIIEKVTKKYPHLLKKVTGPYIDKFLNDKGYYEYKLAYGEKLLFQPSDRIGLPLVLGATIDNFEGISTDFLKYVAAHEYGHHFTLDQTQALNTNDNAILVGGLSTRGGISESSYYSATALKNYLDARSNLEFERVNVLGVPSPKGQYIRFKFIKEDGTTETETFKDIWGSDDEKASVFEITDNPRRRFLQTFSGLQQAAKLRGVKLGDLFLANSFDENSGTLNPSISGPYKSFKKEEVTNADGSKTTHYRLEENTPENVLKDIKDGQGNSLYDLITFNPDGSFTINPYKLTTTKEGDKTITKLLELPKVYNADGTPYINVPLNEPLDKQTVDYIKKQEELLKTTFEAMISRRFFDNGWNNSSTSIGGEIKSGFQSFFGENEPKFVKDNLLYRTEEAEKNPQYNASVMSKDTKRKGHEYHVFNNNTQSNTNLAQQLQSLLVADQHFATSRYALATRGQTNNTWLFKEGDTETAYSFPLTQNGLLSQSINYWENLSRVREIGTDLGTRVSGRVQVAPSVAIVRDGLGFGRLLQNNIRQRVNNSINHFLAIAKNDNSQATAEEIFGLFTNSGLSPEQLRQKAAELINKIVFNKNAANLENASYSLFDAFNDSVLVDFKTSDNKNIKTVGFSSFKDLLEFASIDYSKATLREVETSETDKQNAIYDWNVDYVKTKFDFEKFKKAAKASTNANSKIEDIDSYDDQKIANELMKRFRRSSYFLATKDFNPATELAQNYAIFSEDYGIQIANEAFAEGLAFDISKLHAKDTRTRFDAAKLLEAFKKYIISFVGQENYEAVSQHLNSQDLYRFMGNVIAWRDFGVLTTATFGDIYFSTFVNGVPTEDVINYNQTRIEPLINDKFTDYVYSIAETLTRDYVQTTYVPSRSDFQNLPKFVSGINEISTGLDYVVDATKLSIWNDRANTQIRLNNSIFLAIRGQKFDEYLEKTYPIFLKYSARIEKIRDDVRELAIELDKAKAEKDEKRTATLEKALQDTRLSISQYSDQRINETKPIREKIFGNFSSISVYSQREQRNSSFFGRFISKNNGYFKDLGQKETIDSRLYDDNGDEVVDDSIRLLDFEGNKINTRAKAFFISQLKNYGVGHRNVAGLFRNKQKDAIALYGFVKNETAAKIKKLKFTDTVTKEVKYLDVNISDTNNLFYLQKQADGSSKKTLKDLGYSSWVSDYALMAKYSDTLLVPKHKYFIEFVDQDNKLVEGIELGDIPSLSENGKTNSQASVRIEKDSDNKTIINIDYQFNITG
ncbi:PDxFFG protein [Mycoplasma procyoni]|uniref:PDxFFG protein n=1 Tax=Mycoplasma procyoni TaxID=568784 RepID=UPI00197B503C|nr:PDxFFG protein [Mycoplasma procyoni]MBN3534754.1 PDxFFG protein [Mycoplasma procyoni]